MNFESVRSEMPVVERWAYFDHAAVAPLPRPAWQAIASWAEDSSLNGDVHWPRWDREAEEARRLAAQLLSVDPDEVALLRNTTEGINLAAEGFPWRPGDNVVFPADEFPSNRFPWFNLAERGVEPRAVEPATPGGFVDLPELAAACDARTRILAVSWIDYARGYRRDVGALADLIHRHGGYLFLDAIQGLGIFPLNAADEGVDFLAADGHKWLLGPEGAAVFYLRREHLGLLRPLGLGWRSAPRPREYHRPGLQVAAAASRYEGGTWPVPTFVGLTASMKLLEPFPLSERAASVLRCCEAAAEGLQRRGAEILSCREPARRSGILSFRPRGAETAAQQNALRQHCLDRGVVLSCRAGGLRLSPHVYSNQDDLARLWAALDA